MKSTSQSRQSGFNYINEAYRSFKKKNYENAVIILEKGYSSGDTTPYSMFLLAVSLIYSNNFSRTGIILEHIQRIEPLYEPFVQLKSFISLKSAVSREEAMHIYVAALEKLPADALLRKALRILEDSKDFSALQKNVKLHELVQIPTPGKKFYPEKLFRPGKGRIRRGRKYTLPVILLASSGILCVILFALSPLYYSSLVRSFNQDRHSSNRSDIAVKVDMVDIGGSGYGVVDRINSTKTPEFYASGDVVISEFNEARRLLKAGEFNKGVIILNRIINSNASFMVKEKCEFLIKYVMDSDERTYEEIDIAKLNNKPYLYRGSSVTISGQAANMKQVKGGKSFTLMVGYDGRNFNGITLIFDPENTPVENGEMVEVKGLFITGMGKGNVPYISGEKIIKIK
jgi:tetratricopeptide (TPR) repeat protein